MSGVVAGEKSQPVIRRQHRHDDHQRCGGEDSATPPTVEGEQAGLPRDGVFSEQQSGDDETGKNEEDVDADKSARQPGHACMEEYDQYDGNGPQTFHVGSELAIA